MPTPHQTTKLEQGGDIYVEPGDHYALSALGPLYQKRDSLRALARRKRIDGEQMLELIETEAFIEAHLATIHDPMALFAQIYSRLKIKAAV